MSSIRSFSVGDGDMYYIKHNSSNFTIIDCNLPDDRAEDILRELEKESSGKRIKRLISTHPDDDHINGLKLLDDRFNLRNFYCVKNEATKTEPTESFARYCRMRDSEKAYYLESGCTRCWLNDDDKERRYGSSGLHVLWPKLDNPEFRNALADAASGKSPNNISPIFAYSLEDGVRAVWMGDLLTPFMEAIQDEVKIGSVDILFAPHHGRSSSKPPKAWLDEMAPSLVVIGEADSSFLDYYSGYTHICQNTAGELLFVCKAGRVHIYAENPYDIDGLERLGLPARGKLGYAGTLLTKKRA